MSLRKRLSLRGRLKGISSRLNRLWAWLKLISIHSRIIQGIRGQDAASGAAVLSKDWDFNFVAEKEAEFRDDLREASGVGRKKKKVRVQSRGASNQP